MANLASSTSHQRERAEAVRECAAAIGIPSVTARENASQADTDTARGAFISLIRTWARAPAQTLGNVVAMNTMICDDFAEVKTAAGKAAGAEWLRLFKLHPRGLLSPRGTQESARKNGPKGVRLRRRALQDFQELLEVDRKAALDSVRERKPSDPQISWSEMSYLWAEPKMKRCRESRLPIIVGTDRDGCVHALGPSYKDWYIVDTRTLEDGTEEEFCEVTVGPKGATENITVVISKAPSGEVYRQMWRVLLESRNLLRNARKFVTDCEDADPQISWTELCDLWSKPKAARCAASTQKITVGTDATGCVHVLGPSYKDLYAVSERELKYGTKQEFCTVSVGPHGRIERMEVIISVEESGPVYKKMRRVLIETHNLLSNARAFVADCEAAETLRRHYIPTV